jgi:tetratricopeptide (TPR) repeat protein
MTATLKDLALQKALAREWADAIEINSQILKETPDDVDTMNRLAFAYSKVAKGTEATKLYKKVLAIDPYNSIAEKNIERLKAGTLQPDLGGNKDNLAPEEFLEEPGKTKIIECVNVAPGSIIATLTAGQEVHLKPKRHGIEIRLPDNSYIGALPDDIAFRICRLLEAGNTYRAHVKGISKNCVSVFVRELTRSEKLKNQPSFMSVSSYIPYQQRDESADRPDTTETGTSEEATDTTE